MGDQAAAVWERRIRYVKSGGQTVEKRVICSQLDSGLYMISDKYEGDGAAGEVTLER
jgi:hypothetical protein